MTGRVVSAKSLHTVTVLVERVAKDPLYKKTYVQSKKYLVDDQVGVKVGDIVDFVNCKPISKRKHWKITKIVGKNFAEIAEIDLKKSAEEVISEVMPASSDASQGGPEAKVESSNQNKELSQNLKSEKSKKQKKAETKVSKK